MKEFSYWYYLVLQNITKTLPLQKAEVRKPLILLALRTSFVQKSLLELGVGELIFPVRSSFLNF
jgi:hypothetical protein